MTSAEQARQQLEAGFEQGFALPFIAQNAMPVDDDVRDSAVLMLFGALDRVPAAEGAAAAIDAPIPPELDVLLLRRSNGLRNHAGQIAFPGGGVEPGDADRVATALREANEETGLDPSGVDVLGLLPEAHIPVSGYLVTPVLGWWRLPSKVAADRSESVQVFRVPVAELIDPAARGTTVVHHAHRTFRGPAFRLSPRLGGHLVWGFTAMLLSGVFDSLGWSQPWHEGRLFEVEH